MNLNVRESMPKIEGMAEYAAQKTGLLGGTLHCCLMCIGSIARECR